jgi:hypothetical protein
MCFPYHSALLVRSLPLLGVRDLGLGFEVYVIVPYHSAQ